MMLMIIKIMIKQKKVGIFPHSTTANSIIVIKCAHFMTIIIILIILFFSFYFFVVWLHGKRQNWICGRLGILILSRKSANEDP